MTIKLTNYNNETTTITIEESKLITSRFLNNKMVRLNVDLDGSINDMRTKCERVNRLTNDMYKMLADV